MVTCAHPLPSIVGFFSLLYDKYFTTLAADLPPKSLRVCSCSCAGNYAFDLLPAGAGGVALGLSVGICGDKRCRGREACGWRKERKKGEKQVLAEEVEELKTGHAQMQAAAFCLRGSERYMWGAGAGAGAGAGE